MSKINKSVRAIFNEALEIEDAKQRGEYLSQACRANTALRQSVEELLQANEEAGRFLGGSEYSIGPAIGQNGAGLEPSAVSAGGGHIAI